MQVDRESGRRKELFFLLFFSKLLRSIVPSIKIEHSVFFFNEVSFDLTNGKEEKKTNNYVHVLFRSKRRKRSLFQKWNDKLPSKSFLI